MGPLEQLLLAIKSDKDNIEPNYDVIPYSRSEMLPKKPTTVPFYPREEYFDRNWNPEKYSMESLEALVKAQKLAQNKGIIKTELAKYVLPNMLVEGWDNYGLKGPNYDYPVSKERDRRFKELGLEVNDDSPEVGLTQIYRYPGDKKNGYVLEENTANPMTGDRYAQARYAMAMLAEKASSANGNPEQAIRRWNGKGKAIEKVMRMDGGFNNVKADANNHLYKVKKALEILKDPRNQELVDRYNYLMLYGE